MKFLLTFIASLFIVSTTFAQNKATIAVETFRLQPISTTTQNYIQAKWNNDTKTIGESFAASFTEKLRKAGYTVVTRRNIDSLIEENKLSQTGLVDDAGTTKLRTADFRVIGTIRQFEESEDSKGFAGLLGSLGGSKVSQIKGDVEITVELIARDGTILASASGKGRESGRINNIGALATKVDDKIVGFLTNNNNGAFSEAITKASTKSIEAAVKELTNQLKKINFNEQTQPQDKTINYQNPNFNNLRFVVTFPDSPVAEEVWINKISNLNGRVVIGNNFDRNIINSNTALENYCLNLRKNSANARILIFGIIDSEKINQTTRITMSIRAVDLNNTQIVHSDSIQNSILDISNKPAYDSVVKDTNNKLINKALENIDIYLNKTQNNNTYTLQLTGFQSLSQSNRFLTMLKKNTNVESTEIIDFSNNTLFAEIKFKNSSDIANTLEKDTNVNQLFSINITSVNSYKIIGTIIGI